MPDREILIESESPVCPIQALVERTDDTVYFYLFFPRRKGHDAVRSCWICNRRPAPAEINEHTWNAHTAPMMPQGSFSHPAGGMDIRAEGLEIVWFQAGDSAALLQNGELLAVIPPWSGINGFHGYSRYAVGTGLFAWEITAEGGANLKQRTAASKLFWAEHFTDEYWNQQIQDHARIQQDFYGAVTRHAGINGKNYPPRYLFAGAKNGVSYGITALISAIPQPEIEMQIEDADQFSRIEFGFAAQERFEALTTGVYQMFSSLTRYLYGETTFFAHGHTNPYSEIEGFHALLFLNARLLPQIASPDYSTLTGGTTVNLLWAVPITKAEYDFTVANGVDALLRHAKNLTTVHIFNGHPKFSI